MESLVSIVFPVYNCEKYLERCVDSVRNQTYQRIELILVDDGSKDSSATIIKKYMDIDCRVIGIFQDNQGPSVARNTGMQNAQGEYIMFIDSDDYVDCDYVEQYITAISEKKYDIVMGGYRKITGSHIDYVRKLEDEEFSKYIVMGPCAKIYRRRFLEEN